jgi:predicted Fe-Mo cluster-binding NifX family protein
MEAHMAGELVLAVPSIGEGGLDGERSGHFGHCDCFTMVKIADGAVVEVGTIDNPPHVEGGCLTPVNLLASHGVQALIVAGMGARPLAGFDQAGIKVFFEDATPGIGDAVQMVLDGNVLVMDARHACTGH